MTRRAASGGCGLLRGMLMDDALPECLRKDFEVEPQRPTIYLVQIMSYTGAQTGISTPAFDLRPSGHAGLDLESPHIGRIGLTERLDERRTFRARADQAHVAFQHVPQ